MIDMEVMNINKGVIFNYLENKNNFTLREFLNLKGYVDSYSVPLVRNNKSAMKFYKSLLKGSKSKAVLVDDTCIDFTEDLKLDDIKSLVVIG